MLIPIASTKQGLLSLSVACIRGGVKVVGMQAQEQG